MASLKTTMDRAVKLTALGARIAALSVKRATSDEDRNAIIERYGLINVDYAKETAGIISAFSGLGKNLKGILSVFKVLEIIQEIDDPYEDERNDLKGFCREYAAKYSVPLTETERALIGA